MCSILLTLVNLKCFKKEVLFLSVGSIRLYSAVPVFCFVLFFIPYLWKVTKMGRQEHSLLDTSVVRLQTQKKKVVGKNKVSILADGKLLDSTVKAVSHLVPCNGRFKLLELMKDIS